MRKLDMWAIKARLRCREAVDLLQNEDGIGTVEMMLILVVLIGLILAPLSLELCLNQP